MEIFGGAKTMAHVPSIPIKVDEKNFQSGAIEILQTVRPNWTKNIPHSLKSKVFTDGLSNKLVGFFLEQSPEDIVIVKVFGTNTDMMIDRKAEVETMKLLHERKCGAELYATFENGICYEFVNGSTLEISDCADPSVYPLVAAEMAHMHSGFKGKSESKGSNGHSNGNYNNNNRLEVKCALWDKLNQFNKLAEECLANDAKLKSRLEGYGVTSGWAEGAIRELRDLLESKGMPVTFCHNDLIPKNIVYDSKRKRVQFIDVEYAMLNYPSFDVANHFLEFAGLSDIDYSKFPAKEFRLKWIQEYLKNLDVEGREITLEEFSHWVDLCTPAPHLFWGLWGIYQACHSTITFDYASYVGLRLIEYRKCMNALRIQGELN